MALKDYIIVSNADPDKGVRQIFDEYVRTDPEFKDKKSFVFPQGKEPLTLFLALLKADQIVVNPKHRKKVYIYQLVNERLFFFSVEGEATESEVEPKALPERASSICKRCGSQISKGRGFSCAVRSDQPCVGYTGEH